MGAKAMSQMKAGENPEDWHIHHFRTESDCLSPHTVHAIHNFHRSATVPLGGKFDPKLAGKSPINALENGPLDDEPGPEPEGEEKCKIDALVKQLGGLVATLETSEDTAQQRITAAEAEAREHKETVAELHAKIGAMKEDHHLEKTGMAEERERLKECVHVDDHEEVKQQHRALAEEFEAHRTMHEAKVTQLQALEQLHQTTQQELETHKVGATQKTSTLEQLAATLKSEVVKHESSLSAESHRCGMMERQYSDVQKEFVTFKDDATQKIASLETMLEKGRSELHSEAQRVAAVEKEKDELSSTITTLNERVSTMQEATTNSARDHAYALERLDTQYKDIMNLVQEKQTLVAQLAVKETVPFQDHQALQQAHQTMHQEFEKHKLDATEKTFSLEESAASLKSEVVKNEASLSAETHRYEAMERQYNFVQKDFETYKDVMTEKTTSLETMLEKSRDQLRSEAERLAAVEKEKDELSSTITMLNERVATMQEATTKGAKDNAHALERLGEQYHDIQKLVQEKQKKLAKMAAQESVPFDYYTNAKKEFQALHLEFETYKLEATEKVCSLEAELHTAVSRADARKEAEANRLEMLERERNELVDTVSALNAQIVSMQTATTSQAVESANVLERLAKQYKDIFQVVQEKQAIMAGIAAEEARRGQDGDVGEEVQAALIRNRHLVQEVDALQDKNRALQQELDASKVDTSLKIRKLESSMQTQEKLCRDSDAKINAECRKASALEKERDELSKSVSTLNNTIANMQKKAVTSAEEQKDLSSQLTKQQKVFNELQREHNAVLAKLEQQESMFQELVPLEDYQHLQTQYQMLQKELASRDVSGQTKTNELDMSLATTASPNDSLNNTTSSLASAANDPLAKSTGSVTSNGALSRSHTSILEGRRILGGSLNVGPGNETRRTSLTAPLVAGIGRTDGRITPRTSLGGNPLSARLGGSAQVPGRKLQDTLVRGRTSTGGVPGVSRQSSSSANRSPSAPISRNNSSNSLTSTGSSISSNTRSLPSANGAQCIGSITLQRAKVQPAPRRGVL